MKRTDAAHHVGNLFESGNPLTGQRGSRLDHTWLNAVQEEIAGLIEAADLALDPQDCGQMLQAIRLLSGTSFADIAAARAPGGAAALPAAVRTIAVRGHAVEGLGAATYVRQSAEPGHEGKFRDAKGHWWGLEMAAAGPPSPAALSPAQFGGIGDGVADDTRAVSAALSSGFPLDWQNGTWRITAPLSVAPQNTVLWNGSGARILFDAASHADHVITLNITQALDIRITGDLTIDVNDRASTGLNVANTTGFATAGHFESAGLTIRNWRLRKGDRSGAALYLRGAFHTVAVRGGGFENGVMSTGAGKKGGLGIAGITVGHHDSDAYARTITVEGVLFRNIASEDRTYAFDQDGLKVLAPEDPGGVGKAVSGVVVRACRFENVLGRGIKTQTRMTDVTDNHFIRTVGLAVPSRTSDIAAQSGSLVATGNRFDYLNGHVPQASITLSTTTGWRSAGRIADNTVTLGGATLGAVLLTFPSGQVDPFAGVSVENNTVLGGAVTRFVDFTTNGVVNPLRVIGNRVSEIAVDGVTGKRALIWVRASGPAPRLAQVTAEGNAYGGMESAHLMRARVPGTSMNATLSAFGNTGFVRDWNAAPGSLDPAANPGLPAVLRAAGGEPVSGYFGLQTATVADRETAIFRYNESGMSVLSIAASHGVQSWGDIVVDSRGITVKQQGTDCAFADGTNPGTGNFNCWRSGPGEISIENDSGATRTITVSVLSPN